MESVKQSVKQFVSNNKKKIILWVVLLVIFIIAAVFVYVNYIQPQLVDMEYRANYEFDKTIENELKPNDLKPNDLKGPKKPATIYLFWACWCPNSNKENITGKKLHEAWDTIEDEYENKKWSPSSKYKLDFKKVSENNVDFATMEKLVKKSGEIEGFPSIYLRKEEKVTNEGGHAMEFVVYEFDANPTIENLKEFISHVLKI